VSFEESPTFSTNSYRIKELDYPAVSGRRKPWVTVTKSSVSTCSRTTDITNNRNSAEFGSILRYIPVSAMAGAAIASPFESHC
jgi:hypothetical protein